MVAILEHKFYLSEIIGRKVYLKNERIGRLGDMVIVETGKFPEVSHFVVDRSFGYPSLLMPWSAIRLTARFCCERTSWTRRSSTWTTTKSRSFMTLNWISSMTNCM